MTTQFYNDNADKLVKQYLSKSFEEVHKSWIHLLPSVLKNSHAHILDLGAGAGRDAKYLAERAEKEHALDNSIQIFAVEPAKEFSKRGQETTKGLNVKWLDDSLPALNNISKQEVSFDLILLSAVWMHVPPSNRKRAIRKLANLLKPGGKVVISLRHGQTQEDITEREMHIVCAEELKQLATDVGLFTKFETQKEADSLERPHITWQTIMLQREL